MARTAGRTTCRRSSSTGINRGPPIGTGFTGITFTIFDKWAKVADPHRAAVARGQALFNTIEGFNPRLGSRLVNKQKFTCGFCHGAPEAGTDSAGTWGTAIHDTIGVFTADVGAPPDLPRYTVTSNTGQIVTTTDLGRAAITGRFTDLNKFKTPGLRGLAARAPYFHNGSAATLLDVIDAYQHAGFKFTTDPLHQRESLTEAEKADLVAFLESL
jgi:cytochrome c peroxidase